MTEPTTIVIEALVHEAERPALIAGAEQLSGCLAEAMGGEAWPVRLNFQLPDAKVAEGAAPHAVIVSLLPEIARLDEPFADVAARWRARLVELTAGGGTVFVCNIFRHLPERPNDGQPSLLLQRIRRLNALVLTLSNEFGVGVLDFDRALAHVGGRTLQTDYRLGGVLAAEVAGHTLAWALLSLGLDDAVDPQVQEQAKTLLGNLQQIDALVNRRLALRRAAAARDKAARG